MSNRAAHGVLVAAALVAASCGGLAPRPTSGADAPGLATLCADRMQARVDALAADSMEGRAARRTGGRRAADYVARAFEEAGLEQLPSLGGWFQGVGGGLSPNVLGLVPGRSERVLVISAHYDHLPPLKRGGDRIFNGADDNASGTAAVLELARYFAARARAGERPGPTLLFAAFTGEELGLLGSRAFVRSPPVEREHLWADLNLDMVSRGREDLIFCEPGEGADFLLAAVRSANAMLGELELRVGEHPEWLVQSDQDSFLRAGIPALYFGVEDHEDYHRVTDSAEKVLPELIARVARLVARTVGELDAGSE